MKKTLISFCVGVVITTLFAFTPTVQSIFVKQSPPKYTVIKVFSGTFLMDDVSTYIESLVRKGFIVKTVTGISYGGARNSEILVIMETY